MSSYAGAPMGYSPKLSARERARIGLRPVLWRVSAERTVTGVTTLRRISRRAPFSFSLRLGAALAAVSASARALRLVCRGAPDGSSPAKSGGGGPRALRARARGGGDGRGKGKIR